MKFRDRPGKALTCAIASPDFMPKASSHALTHRAKSANRGGRSSLSAFFNRRMASTKYLHECISRAKLAAPICGEYCVGA